MPNREYRPAGRNDFPRVIDLLTRANLPLAGVDERLEDFLLVFHDGSLAGCAAVERYGSTALLRSVAVAEHERSTGLGQELVRRVLAHIRAEGMESAVLLTTEAADFFRRFGFRVIDRAKAPAAALASVEFQGACPASAIVMQLDLTARALSTAAKKE